MLSQIAYGISIPFIGTTLGSGCVFLMQRQPHFLIQRSLTGFAAGVMTAASVWSLLIPATEQSEYLGELRFIPAAVGFLLGVMFLLFLDSVIPHLHMDSDRPEGRGGKSLKKDTMLLLAVTLHNIPEGMAVGVVLAGALDGVGISQASALALSLGIAIQNFPEGAIISLPLCSAGCSRKRAFLLGTLSGAVEPAAAAVTLLLSSLILLALPYLLSFAAGAMLYVVVEELIPEMSGEPHSNAGTIAFSVGFALMMVLDTVFS